MGYLSRWKELRGDSGDAGCAGGQQALRDVFQAELEPCERDPRHRPRPAIGRVSNAYLSDQQSERPPREQVKDERAVHLGRGGL
jgi:hypothetical protein